MRLRTAVALSAAPAAVAALLLAASPGRAASAPTASAPAACAASQLTVRARAVPAEPSVVRLQVTNRGRVCTVDRIPTVTFGDLDGAATPVPPGESGPYRLTAGGTAHAAVRTVAGPADPGARRVATLTVAADPALPGRTFTASELGAGDSIRVWEPVTTWWQASAAAADRAIGLSR